MNWDKIFKNFLWFLGASKVINNFPDAVIFVNSDGYITQMNKRAGELFILSDGENPVSLNEFIDDGMQIVKSSAKLKKPIVAKANVADESFFVELTASRKNNNFCVSIRDLAQNVKDKETEQAIEKFNKEKNAMLVNIKQDIISPIDTIAGFSKGLSEGLGGELTEKQEKYIKIINNNVNDLREYVSRLFEFSYCESLKYEPNYEKFDAVLLIKDVIKDIEQNRDGSKSRIIFDYFGLENHLIYMDVYAFKHIIKNILEVSVEKDSGDDVSIIISDADKESKMSYGFSENSSCVRIIIKDLGNGIDYSEIKGLCDPYYQMDKGKKNFLRALNLGSATILVKRSDGFIDINSEYKNGITYNIIIPTKKEKDE